MPGLPARLAVLALVLLACQTQAAPAPAPRPTPTAPPTPLLVLRAPAAAVLTSSDVGLPVTAARDHLGAAEAARDTPNEALALQTYSAWEWVEASTRTWSGGGRQASETLLLTLRAQGARKAFASWAADTEREPFASSACPPSLTGLDECRLGTAGDRALVVGYLDAEVFRLETAGLDAPALAQRQAARLPIS